MPKYIDIHAHTNFVLFDEDRKAVISRALSGGTWVINIGTQYNTSKKAVEMTNEYEEGVYACIGLHPIHTSASYHDKSELGDEGREFVSKGEIFDKEKYRILAKEGKVVGIGECGLDYYHMSEDSIEKQKKAFIDQIELANELNLPLMLHIRNSEENLDINAYQDALEILKEFQNNKERDLDTNSARAEFVSRSKEDKRNNSKMRGVIHFFAGSLKDAQDFIDFGFYISFAGVITYPPKKGNSISVNYKDIIKELPLGMIMADTDSPYVAPVPHRGKRNEPIYVKDIVLEIAKIKELPIENVEAEIVANARKLFAI